VYVNWEGTVYSLCKLSVKCGMRCLEEDAFAAGIFDRSGLE